MIFPGSTLVAKEMAESLSPLPHYAIFGAGHDVDFPWLSLFEGYTNLPPIGHPLFQEKFTQLLDSRAISHVMPANEVAIVELARLLKGTGVTLVSHPYETIVLAGSKRRTLETFRDSSFFPESFSAETLPVRFPVFYKPDFGHSSIGTGIFKSQADLEAGHKGDFSWDEFVVTDFLPGREVTVDCFSTSDKGLLFSKARLRKIVENGMSRHTVDFLDESLDEIAVQINQKLDFNGAWFFQARESVEGDFKVLEIGARIAGASGLRRGQGVNLSHLSVLASDGIELEVVSSPVINEAIFDISGISFRGDQPFMRLYVDLDDTLILNGEINTPVLSLIEEACALDIWVAIITRAAYDPFGRLQSFGLGGYFKEVIHIRDGRSKESFIPQENYSILIDDSFRERKACAFRPEILAVDASASTGLGGMLVGPT